MGRGDKRSKKGKIWRGTHGKARPKKKKVVDVATDAGHRSVSFEPDPAGDPIVIIASARDAATGPRSSHLNKRLLTTRSGQGTPKNATE